MNDQNRTQDPAATAPETENTQQYWERLGKTFVPGVHLDHVFKGTRLSFPGAGGITVVGNVAGLTPTGYRLAIGIPGIPTEAVYRDVDAGDVTVVPVSGTAASEPVDAFDLHRHVTWDFERNRDNIVKELRHLADRVERQELPAPNQKNPGFGNLASIIVADVTNMVPNLALSGLVRSAAQADVALLHDRAQMLED